LISKDKSHS